jgi:D-beta-D-heptose 7-phosphate kinase/D-beta-D-heptose 1-phosphate adenosyltransferase
MRSYNLNRLYNIVSRFKDAKILVIGDIMLDRFIWGTVSRVSPEAPVPVVWQKSESCMLGAAANVANNICAHGAKAHISGIIGDDEEGRMLLEELAKKGISSEGIVIDPNRPTITKTRIIAYHQQVVRLDKESERPMSDKLIDGLISFTTATIPDVDAVIIEDYGKGVVIPHIIKEALKVAKRHKKIVTVDPKEEHFEYYKGVAIITPNRKESEIGSGVEIKNVDTLKKAGRRLLAMLHSDAVLITLGEDGMALFKKDGKLIHIPTVAQEVYDVSGAGDTVIATFTVAKVCGADMKEAAHISNVAAGVVVGKLGIAVCTPKELKVRLSQIIRYGIKENNKSYPSDNLFKKR